jgi:protein gp37
LSIEPLLEDLGEIDLTGIAWAIVGGESGPGARPMRAEWVRSIKKQCGRQKVPFFFKQWGGTRKAVAGRVLDGRTYSDFPSVTSSNRSSKKASLNSWAAFVPVEALVG